MVSIPTAQLLGPLVLSYFARQSLIASQILTQNGPIVYNPQRGDLEPVVLCIYYFGQPSRVPPPPCLALPEYLDSAFRLLRQTSYVFCRL